MVDFITPMIAPLLSGAANLIGGFATNSANAAEGDKARQWSLWQQREANAENIAAADRQRWWAQDQAAIQRNWQADMSNTAYQRSMADMRSAGLNPILAAGQGGATTPTGAMPTASASSSPTTGSAGPVRFENVLGGAVQSALEVYGKLETLKQVEAQTEKIRADTRVSDAQAGNVQSQTALNDAQRLVALGVPAEQAQRIATGKASEAEAYSAASLAASRRRLTDDEREFLHRWGGKPPPAGNVPYLLSVTREAGHSAASTGSDASSAVSGLLKRIIETMPNLVPSKSNPPVPPPHFSAPMP